MQTFVINSTIVSATSVLPDPGVPAINIATFLSFAEAELSLITYRKNSFLCNLAYFTDLSTVCNPLNSKLILLLFNASIFKFEFKQ